jgi:flagellar motor switch protein FliM
MATESSVLLLQQRSLSAEQTLPAVEEFFRALSQKVRARLVNRSSSNVRLRLGGVFIKTLVEVKEDPQFKDSGVYGLLRFNGVGAPAAVAIQRPLLTRIIGAMLGDEDGSDEGDETRVRPLSQVEVRIAQRLFRELCQDLMDVWPSQPSPPISLDGVPGQARLIDGTIATEEVYLVTMDFGPAEGSWGLLTVTVPTQALRNIGQSKDANSGGARRRPDMERVLPVEVEMVAEMARVPMRVRDLKKLEIGDLVPLGSLEGALMRINGRALLLAEPGHANGQRSVRVLDRVR